MSKQPIIGGQAVIEGVMFTSGDAISLAVRKPNKKIHVEGKPRTSLVRKLGLQNIPILRFHKQSEQKKSFAQRICQRKACD